MRPRRTSAYPGTSIKLPTGDLLRRATLHNPLPDIEEPLQRFYFLPIVDGYYQPLVGIKEILKAVPEDEMTILGKADDFATIGHRDSLADLLEVLPDDGLILVYPPRNPDTNPSALDRPVGPSLVNIRKIIESQSHELDVHETLSDSTSTCEMRMLASSLMAGVVDTLLSARKTGHKIRIPSFSIVDSAGREVSSYLTNYANHLDDLLLATQLLQEAIAYLICEDPDDWDTLNQWSLQLLNDGFITQQFIDDFGNALLGLAQLSMRLGGQLGGHVAIIIGQTVLNTHGLTKDTMVQRLKDIMTALKDFTENLPEDEADAAFAWSVRINRHIMARTGYSRIHCPMAGPCLPALLYSGSQDRWRSSAGLGIAPAGSKLLASAARLTGHLRCGRVADIVGRGQGYIRDTQKLALAMVLSDRAKVNPELKEFVSPMVGLHLRQCSNQEAAYDLDFGIRGAGNIVQDMFGIMTFEALRQQMTHGDGPFCLLSHHAHRQGEECPNGLLLRLSWDYIESDPDVAEDPQWRWKHEQPACMS